MGKAILVAVGAGLVAGGILWLYDTTLGPVINQTLGSVTGSLGAR